MPTSSIKSRYVSCRAAKITEGVIQNDRVASLFSKAHSPTYCCAGSISRAVHVFISDLKNLFSKRRV